MILQKTRNYSVIEKFLNNNFSSPTHWPDWNIVVSKHYHTDFFYYMAYEDNELIGIFPMHEKKSKFLTSNFSGQYYYIPNGGWIFSKTHDFDFHHFESNLFTKISMSCLPAIDNFNTIYANESYLSETLIIPLDQTLDEIWNKQINSKRRNMIRKAEKEGVAIIKININEIDLFYNYYKIANNKNKILIQSKDFFIDLFNNAKNINFELLFAYLDDKPIGAIVTVNDKDYSFYWLGISINAKNYGQGELLQWEAIKRMRNYGCKFYDLCHINEYRLPHIYQFKSGFSKIRVPIANFRKIPLPFKVINKLLSLCCIKSDT